MEDMEIRVCVEGNGMVVARTFDESNLVVTNDKHEIDESYSNHKHYILIVSGPFDDSCLPDNITVVHTETYMED